MAYILSQSGSNSAGVRWVYSETHFYDKPCVVKMFAVLNKRNNISKACYGKRVIKHFQGFHWFKSRPCEIFFCSFKFF